MNRIVRLLVMLIACSLVMTATIHARELPGSTGIECSGIVHHDGDADQSEGDADKAVPHHHSSCHGLTMQVPANGGLPVGRDPVDTLGFVTYKRVLASAGVDPALRPPNA